MDNGSIWPPPPNIPPPVLWKGKAQWFRPTLLFGIAFNALASFPGVRLLKYRPYTMIEMKDVNIDSFIISVAVLALFIGIPFASWQIRKRLGQKKSILWEIIGLLLCLCPYLTGFVVFRVIMTVWDFDVEGPEAIPDGAFQ